MFFCIGLFLGHGLGVSLSSVQAHLLLWLDRISNKTSRSRTSSDISQWGALLIWVGWCCTVWDSPALCTKLMSLSCPVAANRIPWISWQPKTPSGLRSWGLVTSECCPFSFCLNFSDFAQSPSGENLIRRGLRVGHAYKDKDQLQPPPKWKPSFSLPRIFEFSF